MMFTFRRTGVVAKRGPIIIAEPCRREFRAGGHLYLGTGQWCRWCGRASISPTSERCRSCNAERERGVDAYVPWPQRPATPPGGACSDATGADVAEACLYARVRDAVAAFGQTLDPENEHADAELARHRERHTLQVREHARHAAGCEAHRVQFFEASMHPEYLDAHREAAAVNAVREVFRRHDIHTEFGVRIRAGEVELVFPGEREGST